MPPLKKETKIHHSLLMMAHYGLAVFFFSSNHDVHALHRQKRGNLLTWRRSEAEEALAWVVMGVICNAR